MQGASYNQGSTGNQFESYQQQQQYENQFAYDPNSNPQQQQQQQQFSGYNSYGQPLVHNSIQNQSGNPQQPVFNAQPDPYSTQNIHPRAQPSDPNSVHQQQFDPYQMLGIPNLETNPAAQLGAQFAGNAMNAMQENVGKNMTRFFNLKLLKRYFDVTNSYVLDKVKILALPWFHRRWYRLVERDSTGQPIGFKSPREDSNSNDLYIPLMALITYITAIGIISGANGTFHPSYLGSTGSKAMAIVFFEVLTLKLICYLLNVGSELVILDMISLSGYKFLMVIPPVLAKLSSSGVLVWSLYIYFTLALAFFMTRSLRIAVIPEASQTTGTNVHRKRRVHFLFVLSVLQFLWCYILVNLTP